ncbi:MAG: hypothetical protein KDA41_00040, partial [Planctomycetales bacterium]|nr:hypothetical protein [Planctomycetales bacterium]
NLIGLWAAMAPGRVVFRLPWSFLLAVLAWYALVVGNRMRQFHLDPNEATLLGVILVAGTLFIQGPMWLAAKVFGWRLRPPALDQADATSGQFGIRHLLVGMGAVAAALGAGRVVLPTGGLRWPHLDRELPILLPVIAVANLVVVLPCLWGAFLAWKRLALLAAAWLPVIVVVSVMQLLVVMSFLGPVPDAEVYVAIVGFNLVQCLTVVLTLLALRGVGFELTQRPPRPTAEAGA